MFAKADPDLKLRFLWLALGYGLVMMVVYLSITSEPIDMGQLFLYEDKVYHAFAYFTLMIWFAQIYHDRFQRNMIALVFIFMGLLLEYLQSIDPARLAEVADVLANIIGVAIGFYMATTPLKNTLVKFETIFFR